MLATVQFGSDTFIQINRGQQDNNLSVDFEESNNNIFTSISFTITLMKMSNNIMSKLHSFLQLTLARLKSR